MPLVNDWTVSGSCTVAVFPYVFPMIILCCQGNANTNTMAAIMLVALAMGIVPVVLRITNDTNTSPALVSLRAQGTVFSYLQPLTYRYGEEK
jgi:hypothetical protein